MNERIDKELDAFMDARNNEVSIDETAEYFYSLALQDVRAELERFIREECCPGYSGINVCRDMIKFIDNLVK